MLKEDNVTLVIKKISELMAHIVINVDMIAGIVD